MANPRTDNRAIPDSPESLDFSDAIGIDYYYSAINGLNDFGMGVEQFIAEGQEIFGLQGEGYAQFITEQLKKRRTDLEDITSESLAQPGAEGTRLGASLLPFLAAPFGATPLRAAGFGGAAGSVLFQEDVKDIRLPEQLIGVGSGFLLGKLLLRGGSAKAAAENTIKQLEGPSPAGLLTGPRPGLTGPARGLVPSEQALRGTLLPRETNALAVRGANEPLPPIQGNLAPPRPRGPQNLLEAPDPTRTAALKAGIGELTRGGVASEARIRQLMLARATDTAAGRQLSGGGVSRATGPATKGKAGEFLSVRFGMSKARDAMLKLKASKAAARLEKETTKLTKAIKSMEKAAKKASPRVKPQLTAKIAATAEKKMVADQLSKAIKAKTKKLSKPKPKVAGITAEEAKRISERAKATSDAQAEAAQSTRAAKEASREDDLDRQAQLNAAGFGDQGGFAESNLVNLAGGAVAGGVLGAAGAGAAGENPIVGAALGAATLGLGARAAGKFMDNYLTSAQKAGMRKAAEEGGTYDEAVTRFAKTKDYSSTAIASVLTGGAKVLDSFLGATMTRLEAAIPGVAAALKNAEWQQHNRANIWLTKGDEIYNRIDAADLTDSQRQTFKVLLLNSSANGEKYLRGIGKTDAADAVGDMRGLLDDVGSYLGGVGLGHGLRKNYAPRQVVDTSFFEKIPEIQDHLTQLAHKKGIDLTDFEKETEITNLINGALHTRSDLSFARASGNLQKRTIKVNHANVDAYADPHQAFNDYIETVTMQAERRRFFNGQGIDTENMGIGAENMEGVADKLGKALTRGGVEKDNVAEAVELIKMRFGPGEQAPHKFVQNFKNLTYAGLLGNPLSAMTQFGDIALSAHRNGIFNTARGVVAALGSKGKLNGLDKQDLLGIRNAAADFTSKVGTRDILNWSLKYSGFQAADKLGKNTFIQSAMLKNKQKSKSDFLQDWKATFDPEGGTARTEGLWQQVQDFEKITPENREDLGFMLWNELSGVQPISLSALPEQYLKNPNGRMAYMLQSFTLKLFDVMRKDIVQQARKGNYREATKNTVKLSSLFVGMNGTVDMAKNFITGKDQSIPDVVLNNYMKLTGFNKFAFDAIAEDGLGKGLINQIAPPTALFDAVTDPSKAIDMIPILGRTTKQLRDM